MLYSTKPKTASEAAVIARSRQLTDFKWTPVRDIPTFIRSKGNGIIPAGIEVSGFPYASNERTDKFFCENISFETFLSVIANPDSKLYQPGHAAYSVCNYGIVCNGLVRYALGIDYRVSTARWHTIPGMRMIKARGEYTLRDVRLCDVLYVHAPERSHVALITDVLRDESGEAVAVEISEAVRPLCVRRTFSAEGFSKFASLFGLWRYDLLESVPPFDEKSDELLWHSGIEKRRPRISVDNGNKSNYSEGDEILFSVFAEGENTVIISRDGEFVEEVKTFGRAFFPRVLNRGYYTATLKCGGESVEFAVTSPKISFEVCGGYITVKADPRDEKSIIHYMDYRQKGVGSASLEKYEVITEEERRSGVIRRPLVPNGENFKVYFKNPYGIWTHKMIHIPKER